MAQVRMSQVEPHFVIFSDNENAYNATENALRQIKSGPNGMNLIQHIVQQQTNEKYVQINGSYAPEMENFTTPRLTQSQMNQFNGRLRPDNMAYHQEAFTRAGNGEGVRAEINFHPMKSIDVDPKGKPSEGINPLQSFVCLGHELVHAYHMIKGDKFGTDPTLSPREDGEHYKEELRAVGFHSYSDNPLSENGIRADHNLPIRKGYFPG